jgi:aryl-alcohol dehydrogenase-like predicted oxidoreductase
VSDAAILSAAETATLAPGYVVSRLIKGGWQLAGGHGAIERDAALAHMRDYLRAGITTFDCADIYTGVEELIGAFRSRGDAETRRVLRVHTKFVPDLAALARITRDDVRALIARSAARLGMPRLDLVQFHWWDMAVPRHVEVAGWLAELRDEGRIELLGGTNFDAAQTAAMLEAGVPLRTMQVQYSILDDRPERTLVPLCARAGMQLLCYGTVAGGFFSERWLGVAEPVGPLPNRSLTKYKLIIDDSGGWELFQAMLRVLQTIAARHGTDIASVATRWVLDRPLVAAAIVGARDAAHLPAHGRVRALLLTERDRRDIAAVMAQRTPLAGDVYALERDRSGRHGRIMKYDLGR